MKAYLLFLLAILVCLSSAGCGTTSSPTPTTVPAATSPVTQPVTEPPTEPPTEPEPTQPPTSPVLDVLAQLYEPDGAITPVDYQRLSYLPMEGLNDLITWTVDTHTEHVTVVVEEDGTVTVNVNELCPEEISYVLTASVVNADGIRVYHSWEYILPQARDMAEILDEAYALPARQQLPYYATLTGKITSVDKAWSEDYQNVTLIIRVESAGNRAVRCYSLVGEGVENLKIGDVITVTGILQKYGSIVEFDAGCTLQTNPTEETAAPA